MKPFGHVRVPCHSIMSGFMINYMFIITLFYVDIFNFTYSDDSEIKNEDTK